MNKKGQAVLIYSFMIGMLCFVLGIALSPSLHTTIAGNSVMNSSQLDCYNSSISNQNKSVCTQVDTFPPIYTGIIFGLAGFAISAGLGGR